MPYQHTFVDNEIKAFVYTIFGFYDKHAPVDEILRCLANDENLEMTFPGCKIRSPQAFREWYDNIGNTFLWNVHWIEKIDVKVVDNHKYQVDLVLVWEALSRENGQHSAHRVQQEWLLAEDNHGSSLKIQRYVVTRFDPLATTPPIPLSMPETTQI